jgi:S1-C subfamily serine protease
MENEQDPFVAPPPTQPPAQGPSPQPHRARRTLAAVAVTAVVAGAVGVGAGYVGGHGLPGGQVSTASGETKQQSTSSGSPGTEPIPNNPGWRWSTGGGSGQSQAPSNPFGPFGSLPGQGGSGGSDGSSGAGAKASAKQLTGLVRIVSTMKYSGAKAAGTGMVLTSDGEVVTNHHVVEGATSVRATVMSTGKTYVAKVVGTDAKDDVALLQLSDASGLGTVTTDTNGVSVGDKVTAVGDANGTTDSFNAASGKVLTLGKSITTQTEGTAQGERLTGLIEISSDVVGGDSGGATYDAQGEVVGMTTAASSGQDVNGYAVPISKVVSIADDLESEVNSSRYDYGRPAFLGVALAGSTTQVQGAYPGTPAADAGISTGSRITSVDGTSVSTAKALRSAVASHSPGDSVSVTWTDTAGGSHTATVTLGTGPVE